jgi:hypothetical protein
MANPEHNGHADHDRHADHEGSDAHETGAAPETGAAQENHEDAHNHTSEVVTVAATVGVVAVGAALVEVALIPGIALGVAAMLAPKYVPKLGSALTPMFRSSVRGIYKFGQKSREMMAEAKEQVHDIVAEVHAEAEPPKAAAAAAADAPRT